jgi:aspartate/methionine/tyrosine aminotransferase
MKEILERMLYDDILPNHLPDVQWLKRYIDDGAPHGDPILLSLGDTWSRTPEKLLDYLCHAPRETHGYQLSMYGLPKLRKALRTFLVQSHNLEAIAPSAFEVAVSWSGTRSTMFDFGRFLQSLFGPRTPCAVIAPIPGWDYAGVFEPLGFPVFPYDLLEGEGFRPRLPEFYRVLEQVQQTHPLLIVLNVQQNPTGVNWSEPLVRQILQIAVARGAAVLIDDAYYGVHDPGVVPTSAVKILLEELQKAPESPTWRRWLAVRSLGKQFHCNGWALGSACAHPETLDRLVNEIKGHHEYNYGGHLQHAMAEWLADPESASFLQKQSREYYQKRRFISSLFECEFPHCAYHCGDCTPYILFSVPETAAHSQHDVHAFLEDCFFRTGVLFSSACPSARTTLKTQRNFVRVYLGPHESILQEAFDRLGTAKILS